MDERRRYVRPSIHAERRFLDDHERLQIAADARQALRVLREGDDHLSGAEREQVRARLDSILLHVQPIQR